MKKLGCILATALLVAHAGVFAAEQTWSGKISDSACGAKHEEAAEGQGVMADRDCTQACVRGGYEYLLVCDGKTPESAHQEFKELAPPARPTLEVTRALNRAATK